MLRKREKQPATNPKVLHKDRVLVEPLKLRLGAKIEALEDNNLWYPAKVIGIDESKQRILVHFCGFNSRYDKWYDGQGNSVRPLANNRDKMESASKEDGQQSMVDNSLVQSLFNAPNKPKNMIFCKEEFNGTSIEENRQRGSNLDHIQAKDGCLAGLSFNFSGFPRNFSVRSQLRKFVIRYNGSYHVTFNKYTKYLIVGNEPTRKVLDEAKLWGTPVIDEDSFFDFVKQSTSEVSFVQQCSKSSEYISRLELSSTIKPEMMSSPEASVIPQESESANNGSQSTSAQLPKTTARKKRQNVTARSDLANKASIEENDRNSNSDEVVNNLHIPLTPCEEPANNFETSLDGPRLPNTGSSSAHTALSPLMVGSTVKRRSKKPAAMTNHVSPRKKRKPCPKNESSTNIVQEMSGGKQKPQDLIITTDLTERRIISPETIWNGERPKLTHQKRRYVRKTASRRLSTVNDEKDGPEIISRKVMQDGKAMRVECVFQEEARLQSPEENVVQTEGTSTNQCGDKGTSNGHTTLSQALSASSGFQSDESSNSRQNIRRSLDTEKEVTSDSRPMIDSRRGGITAENSERTYEQEQQSICEAQSSSSIQNKRASERSNSTELDSIGRSQAACDNSSHQSDIDRESLVVSTPPLSFSRVRSLSITERNAITNTPLERHSSYVQCPEHCGTILGTEQVESHLKLNCFNAETECDICGFKMLRKDLHDHIARNAAKHISLMAAELQSVKNINKTIVADNVKLRQKLNGMITTVTVLEERCKRQELLNDQ